MKAGNILRENNWKKIFGRGEVTVILAVLTLGIIFTIFSESFLTSYNMFNMGRTAAIYIFIAIGQALVVIVGGMNLSLGQIGGMTVVGAGYCMEILHMPPLAAVIAGLLVGVLAGLLNGFIITALKLNSFVVTLATSFIFTGLINGVSQGYPYNDIPEGFTFIGREGFLGIPFLLWLAAFALILLGYFFKYTVTGRRVLATGGNIEAAKMSGVNTNKMIILANIGSGVFAAMAGLLWISRTGSAQPSTGVDWMVISFAVAVIGGTVLKGGVFNPIGVFFAGFLIVMVKNGLVMLNANIYFEQAYLGLILLLAVSLDSIKNIINARKLKESLKRETIKQ
ncbi:MAG TPA: ABC transporter permease [Clostridiales bacterium]|nr:ABC transporter permease [Clostridiales bacterium]